MNAQQLFSAATYAARRHRLGEQLGQGFVLLMGLEESPINYTDNVYRFRQDSSFLYFVGIAQPGLAALIDLENGTTALFGDDPTLDDLVWTGPQTPLVELAEAVGADTAAPRAELATAIARIQRLGRRVHTVPIYRAATDRQLTELFGAEPAPSIELIDAVVAQRSIKTPEEIEQIEQAVTVSTAMHLAALRAARPGIYEREIAAEIEAIAAAAGMRTAFPIIATVRGETLHNHHHHRRLESGQLFLTDTGAETTMGYAGDLSRTGPVDRTFTSRQRDVYQLTLAAHRAASAAVAPGTTYLEVHKIACHTLVDGLKQIGLMRGDTENAVAAGAHALFFPCGTGHMLGLDVHDMEPLGEGRVGYGDELERNPQFGLRSLRLARTLEPGFVLTVEPGVYFIPSLIDQWASLDLHREFIVYEKLAAYRDFGGIRSEDNLLVIDDGARVLGPHLPVEIEEIEALKAE